jgi:hypothetical protein
MKWVLDHDAAVAKAKNYDCSYAIQVPYALVNYPFSVKAERGAGLPLMGPDRGLGHYVFRSAYVDPQAAMISLNLLTQPFEGMHYELQGMPAFLNLTAFGKRWVSSQWKVDPAVKNARNTLLGGAVQWEDFSIDGVAMLGVDFDALYMREAKWAHDRDPAKLKKEGWKLAYFPSWTKPFIDMGVRASGTLVVDYTGKCGAPVLLVFRNRLTVPVPKAPPKPAKVPRLPPGVKLPPGVTLPGMRPAPKREPAWELEVPKDTVHEGNVFRLGQPDAACMQGTVLWPAKATISRSGAATEFPWDKHSDRLDRSELVKLRVTGGNEQIVVLTVQEGAAPEASLSGEGPTFTVTVGKRVIHFDERRARIE